VGPLSGCHNQLSEARAAITHWGHLYLAARYFRPNPDQKQFAPLAATKNPFKGATDAAARGAQ
jgi:hypothetical protein